jgi:two-component system LytT family response regulator
MHATPPIRTLIVEDERLAREHLAEKLRQEPDILLVGQCANGVDALRAIAQAGADDRPELVLLDVQMPDLDGIEFAESLIAMAAEVETPELLFVTAFSEYMERAYELHAIDYLRKPYNDARLASALTHVRRRIAHRRAAARLSATASAPDTYSAAVSEQLRQLVSSVRLDRPPERIALHDRTTGEMTFVSACDVIWVEAAGNGQVILHGREGDRNWPLGIESAQRELARLGFVRVHRNALVHPDHIQRMQRLGKGEFRLMVTGGAEVETGRTYAPAIEELLAATPGAR